MNRLSLDQLVGIFDRSDRDTGWLSPAPSERAVNTLPGTPRLLDWKARRSPAGDQIGAVSRAPPEVSRWETSRVRSTTQMSWSPRPTSAGPTWAAAARESSGESDNPLLYAAGL